MLEAFKQKVQSYSSSFIPQSFSDVSYLCAICEKRLV